MPIDVALDMTSSTYEEQVQVLTDMTEGSVGVSVDDPTIGTKCQLPSLPPHSEGLPHQTGMPVEVVSKNSLSRFPVCCGGTTADRLGGAAPEKADKAAGRYFVRPSAVYKGTHPAFIVN